jgi:hypothetical protein
MDSADHCPSGIDALSLTTNSDLPVAAHTHAYTAKLTVPNRSSPSARSLVPIQDGLRYDQECGSHALFGSRLNLAYDLRQDLQSEHKDHRCHTRDLHKSSAQSFAPWLRKRSSIGFEDRPEFRSNRRGPAMEEPAKEMR